MALYDAIARLYDPWSKSVVEDVDFYVEEALASGGPVVELAVGTGRIAVPTAQAGVRVIGVDISPGMLEVARESARVAGVEALTDFRFGDMRDPPVSEPVALVTIPFRSVLHLKDEAEKLEVLRAAHRLLGPGGRLVFDVFTPSPEDVAETDGRWLEREPGIFERADWDLTTKTLVLSVRSDESSATLALHWLGPLEWRELLERAGFDIVELYGWFDRRPFVGEEDTIWIAERRA